MCTVNLEGCEFTNNAANEDGGAVMCSAACVVEVNNCNFAGNEADYAGGIYIDEDRDSTIAGTSFSGNNATEDGGAIYIIDSNAIGIAVTATLPQIQLFAAAVSSLSNRQRL